MEFKIISHVYENTGGNTMVSFFQVWLPEEKRTIFVNVNEEGATFSVVDFYHGEIDDYFDTIICDFTTDKPDVNHQYFEIFRYCLNEYVVRDCRKFGYTTWMPYELLSDELQKKVSPEYKKWVGNNNYETNGHFVYEDADFIARKRTVNEIIKRLDGFKRAYNHLLDGWCSAQYIDLDFNMLEAIESYPFEKSFDEYNVDDWVDEMIVEIKNKF